MRQFILSTLDRRLSRVRETRGVRMYLLFIVLALTSCAGPSESMERGAEDGPISYLALGDSYTIGQGIEEDGRWPLQLADSLALYDISLSPVEIIARTGWTTTDLQNAIDESNLENYDLVSLLIGVNNQYRRQDIERFRIELRLLIDDALRMAGPAGHVFLVSIPDYGVTPFAGNGGEAIGREIDAYNAIIAAQAEERDLLYIDITEISRELGDAPTALAADRLHPSAFQYSRWVNAMIPELLQILVE